jgi:hypothetical protein
MNKKIAVSAECHSDDQAAQVQFDAAPWLKKATIERIVKLAKCGWGGDYGADQVAMDMADKNSDIADMFKYIEIRNKVSKEHIGFECHVDATEARAWIQKNRPRVFAKLPKEDR